MNAECSVCGQVKAGPVPIQPSSGGGATGGVIVRAGDPPIGPFVCFDCLGGRPRAWTITAAAHRELPIEDRHRFAYELSRRDEVRRIVVEFTGTVASCDPASLPSPLGAAVETHGRSIVEAGLTRAEPPEHVLVTSDRITITPREDFYEEGDRVFVLVQGHWREGLFLRAGDPDEAEPVDDTRTTTGQRRRDVALVQLRAGGEVGRYLYEHIRAKPPQQT